MNIYLSIICLFHIIIWLFVFIGGFFNEYILKINLFLLLPLIFIIQSFFSLHFIVKHKINYIKNNYNYFNTNYKYNLTWNEQNDIKKISLEENIPYNETYKYFMIMKAYEHYWILPLILDYFREKLDYAYRNPFDAAGLLTLGYIINIFIINIKK